MNRILGRAVYQLSQCKMRQVEANLQANLAVEASGQVAAGRRMNTQSKILYTRQYLQVCGDAWRVSAACAAVGLVRGCVR